MTSFTQRRISSLYTLPMKIIPVPFLSVIVGMLIGSIILYPKEMLPNGAIVLVVFVATLVFFAWHSRRMKFVTVDFDNLYVSDWFKKDAIPLANVQYVDYSPGNGLIIVRLKSPSAFGGTIAFMPTWATAFLFLFGQHSILEELREMSQNASARSLNAL